MTSQDTNGASFGGHIKCRKALKNSFGLELFEARIHETSRLVWFNQEVRHEDLSI